MKRVCVRKGGAGKEDHLKPNGEKKGGIPGATNVGEKSINENTTEMNFSKPEKENGW